MELVRDQESKEPATEETLELLNECKINGLVVGKSGPFSNVVRVGPPLTITEEQIATALEILEKSLKAVEKRSASKHLA